MHRYRRVQTASRVGGFFARHFLALGITVAVPCLLWTITYFVLLLWATVSGGGLGSPASYPLGLLFVLIGGTGVALSLLLPPTALAEWFARRRGLPILAEIPISVSVLAILCLAVVGIATAMGSQPSVRGASVGFGFLFLSLLLPLGLYWWSARSGSLLLSLLRSFSVAGRKALSAD